MASAIRPRFTPGQIGLPARRFAGNAERQYLGERCTNGDSAVVRGKNRRRRERYDLMSGRGYFVCQHCSNRRFGRERLRGIGVEGRGRTVSRAGESTFARDARGRALADGRRGVSGGQQGRVLACT